MVELLQIVKGEEAQGYLGCWPYFLGRVLTNPTDGEIWRYKIKSGHVFCIRVGCNQTDGNCLGQNDVPFNRNDVSAGVGATCQARGMVSIWDGKTMVYCGKCPLKQDRVEDLKGQAKLMGSEVV